MVAPWDAKSETAGSLLKGKLQEALVLVERVRHRGESDDRRPHDPSGIGSGHEEPLAIADRIRRIGNDRSRS
jgi:hypothetical protein